jgi:hypothetical protein
MSDQPQDSEDVNKLFQQLAGSATMSPLDDQSNQLHEVFLSLMKAGFTEKQALYIISMSVVSFDTYLDDSDEDEEEEISIYISPKDLDLQEITEEDSSATEEEDKEEPDSD